MPAGICFVTAAAVKSCSAGELEIWKKLGMTDYFDTPCNAQLQFQDGLCAVKVKSAVPKFTKVRYMANKQGAN